MQQLSNKIHPSKNSQIGGNNKGTTEFSHQILCDAINETVKTVFLSNNDYIIYWSNKALNTHLSSVSDCSHHSQDYFIVEDPQSWTQLDDDSKGSIGSFNNENETNLSDQLPPFKWNKKALERLLHYLKKNIDDVRALDKRNGDGTKKKLWDGASEEVCKESHEYNSTRCSIKWKNVKQNYIKWLSMSGKNGKKPDPVEIIDNELIKLSYDEITGRNKRKTTADEKDNSNRKKTVKSNTM
ncbi:hypothetical protein RhiirA5_425011 [Rhizophagus irregularis]|uniref:Myb/SANT-like DNA-binding domain-containing protein n=1 Tax=Rhizophagus irregularis TaxID=588596 RepID=A0A2N0P6Y0_9GLOM|nr:hypothetical protein RhiirA5_425011 [Rhizophagus irregularis]CAB4378758.1 unnamed protein product [Rhizophagus irregularis]CAB5362449.1 unnamed protein product [Rhizophagus irregularis]